MRILHEIRAFFDVKYWIVAIIEKVYWRKSLSNVQYQKITITIQLKEYIFLICSNSVYGSDIEHIEFSSRFNRLDRTH